MPSDNKALMELMGHLQSILNVASDPSEQPRVLHRTTREAMEITNGMIGPENEGPSRKELMQLLNQCYGNLIAARGAYDAIESLNLPDVFQGLGLCQSRLEQNISDLEPVCTDLLQVYARSHKTSDKPVEGRIDLLMRSDID